MKGPIRVFEELLYPVALTKALHSVLYFLLHVVVVAKSFSASIHDGA